MNKSSNLFENIVLLTFAEDMPIGRLHTKRLKSQLLRNRQVVFSVFIP